MPYPANTPDLTELLDLPLGEIAALPPEELLRLQEEATAAFDAARHLKERLEGAIAQRYGAAADAARRAAGKDTGTVRLEDGTVVVIADLPKRVTWDQAKLAQMVERIRDAKDDPSKYLEISYRVAERKFTAWSPAMREGFAVARTVGTGKPSFKLELRPAP